MSVEQYQNFCDRVALIMPGVEIKKDELMSKHTTFRIGGPADLFVSPYAEEIPGLLRLAKEDQIPVTIIGNGSNLLVADKGIRGLVIEIGKGLESISFEGNRVTVGAGTLLSRLANAAAENNLTGLEFAAGIPGSVGGAVVMNAGAYGGEMKDVLVEVKVLDEHGEEKVLSLEELDLSYRHSCILENNYIVVEATMDLQMGMEDLIREKMAKLRDQRVEKQPLEFPSAGSTF